MDHPVYIYIYLNFIRYYVLNSLLKIFLFLKFLKKKKKNQNYKNKRLKIIFLL